MMIDNSPKDKMRTSALLGFNGVFYPKFGNIVILAGGSASGKTLHRQKLLGIDGKVFNVDELSMLMRKSELSQKRLWEEFKLDLKSGNLKDPQFVTDLHRSVKKMGYDYKRYEALKYTADLKTRKPNLIFDVTLSSFKQFSRICKLVKNLHYERNCIHLVWVLTTLELCLKQNAQRDRFVPPDCVKENFEEVSQNLLKICRMGDKITKYFDGELWISFNRANIDTKVRKNMIGDICCFEKSCLVKIKSAGESITFPQLEGKRVTDRIYEYTGDSDWKEF